MENSNCEKYVDFYLKKDNEKISIKNEKALLRYISTVLGIFIGAITIILCLFGVGWLLTNLLTVDCTCVPELCVDKCSNTLCDTCSGRFVERPLGFLFASMFVMGVLSVIPAICRECSNK
jgi:hypothetical protein